ncbi:MAG TPA: triple tyrosine motif-containing protein [Terriglobales bacterium]|nr:triple tyrosine motif-containing protein [Terriglobales bacterium]
MKLRSGCCWMKMVRGFGSGIPFQLLLIVLVVACGGQMASAGSAVPQGQRIIHEHWTFKEGAPESVEAVAQTGDGYLWLGTPSGLFRFDGIRFELFHSPFGDQLPSTNVSSLFAPITGGLWVGYRFGGFSFLKDGRVLNFVDFPASTGSTGTIQNFAQDRHGILWASTMSGVWRFDGSSWQPAGAEWDAPKKPVMQVGFDREGILWVLTLSTGLEGSSQLFYLLPDSRTFRKAGEHLVVQGFTSDADYNVLTTHERRTGEPGSGIELESSLPAYPILKKNSDQILDRANGIWFLPNDRVVLHHPAGEPLADIVSSVSRSNSQIYDIDPYRYARLVDREGSIWMGDPSGLHRFAYSPLMQPELPKGRGAYFTVAPDEGGAVWISNGNGDGSSTLYRVLHGKPDFQKPQNGLTTFAYRAPDKTCWFGGEGGLWHMINRRLTRIELPPEMADKAPALLALTEDGAGGIWVSFGRAGLYRFRDGVWTKNGGRSDLSAGSLIAFTDSEGRVWFGFPKNRITVLDRDRVQDFGPGNGVQVGNVTALYARGPEMWIGGEFGLQQFDRGRFHTIHAVDKQSFRGISGIVETANGDLWLNGLGGIVHLRRAEIAEALKRPDYQVSSERFGRHEGLPGLPSQLGKMPTAIEGTDGRLWFTVYNGVVWLDPARTSNRIPPPPVAIQAVSAGDKGYAPGPTLRFATQTPNVQVSWAAVSLKDTEAIRFRYKLRGMDEDWHEAGTSTSVTYRHLPPGSYHFLVNATDANGVWSDNTATVDFTMLPAFYQRSWFRLLCATAFLGLLWAVYQWRVRYLRHRFEITLDARVGERTRIARELHDTLLQKFQGILPRLQAVIYKLPDGAVDARKTLQAAVDQASQAITEGRDSVQGLRMSTLEKNDLALAIRTLGEELSLTANQTSPRFEVVVEGTSRSLHPLLRDEIYRVAAEALRNAFRHAQAHQIEVEIGYGEKTFTLHVRDDGRGIDRHVLSGDGRAGHFGLHGMRERANLVGGKLEIWSAVASGTEIELSIPSSKAYAKPPRRFRLFQNIESVTDGKERTKS